MRESGVKDHNPLNYPEVLLFLSVLPALDPQVLNCPSFFLFGCAQPLLWAGIGSEPLDSVPLLSPCLISCQCSHMGQDAAAESSQADLPHLFVWSLPSSPWHCWQFLPKKA